MKTFGITIIATAAIVSLAMGCASGRDHQAVSTFEGVSYVLAPGQTFEAVVNSAAVRRRWTPQKMDNGAIRCTLVQREHKVVVDVVRTDSSFSIIYVESNIPPAKYNQWVNNLCREIVARASRAY